MVIWNIRAVMKNGAGGINTRIAFRFARLFGLICFIRNAGLLKTHCEIIIFHINIRLKVR